MGMFDYCQHGVSKYDCGICRKGLKTTPSIDFFEKPKIWELKDIPVNPEFDLKEKLRHTVQPPEFKNVDKKFTENLNNDLSSVTDEENVTNVKSDLDASPELIDITKKFLKKED
jgi:hypothetical protein